MKNYSRFQGLFYTYRRPKTRNRGIRKRAGNVRQRGIDGRGDLFLKFITDAGYSGPMGLRCWRLLNRLAWIYTEKHLPMVVK